MSGEATGFVYRHSPLKGKDFDVHLAIADSVNDQYHNEFWMSPKRLAAKARCGRATVFAALTRLTNEGFLVLLEPGDSRRHLPARYRFMFPEKPVVFDSHPSEPIEIDHGGRPVNPVQPSDEVNNLVQPLDGVYAAKPSPIPDKPSLASEASTPKPSPTAGLHKNNPSKVFTSTQAKEPKHRGPLEVGPFTLSGEMPQAAKPWRQRRRGTETEIPEGFPTPVLIAEGKTSHPSIDVDHQTARFVNWAKSKGITYRDWPAGYRNWLLGAVERARSSTNGNGNGHKPYSSSDIATPDEYAAAIAAAEASENGWGI